MADVAVIVPHAFTLRLAHGPTPETPQHEYHFSRGANTIPEELLDHWYVIANGVHPADEKPIPHDEIPHLVRRAQARMAAEIAQPDQVTMGPGGPSAIDAVAFNERVKQEIQSAVLQRSMESEEAFNRRVQEAVAAEMARRDEATAESERQAQQDQDEADARAKAEADAKAKAEADAAAKGKGKGGQAPS